MYLEHIAKELHKPGDTTKTLLVRMVDEFVNGCRHKCFREFFNDDIGTAKDEHCHGSGGNMDNLEYVSYQDEAIAGGWQNALEMSYSGQDKFLPIKRWWDDES